MFDIGWSELLVIGIVALIAIGPKELPAVLRTVGQWMSKIRRMAAEFQGQFQEAMREAEMAELKKQVDEMTTAATELSHLDPMEPLRKEIDSLSVDPLADSSPPAPAATASATAPADADAPQTQAPIVADAADRESPPAAATSTAGAFAADAPQPKSGGGG
jgi:sec-independent protein translocase protein TatB